MPFFHLTTDTGKHITLEANWAGDAVGMALRKFKGCRITECFAGDETNGKVTYEIPKHAPMPPKVKRKKPVQTELFG